MGNKPGKEAARIVAAMQYMKISKEYFDDFARNHPDTKGASMCRNYSKKIEWFLNDMLTNPGFDDRVRGLLRKERDIDPLLNLAFIEKVSQIKPDQRHLIEDLLDTVLSGAELQIETSEEK